MMLTPVNDPTSAFHFSASIVEKEKSSTKNVKSKVTRSPYVSIQYAPLLSSPPLLFRLSDALDIMLTNSRYKRSFIILSFLQPAPRFVN
jgi:hypothetical protein